MSALLLLDLQNDFLHPNGALPVVDGLSIIKPINALKMHAKESGVVVVHTLDNHPPNHISFASRHPDQKLFTEINLPEWKQLVVPDHCVKGTWGAQMHEDVSPAELVILKGTDAEIESHSAFYDIRGATTGLQELLLARSIRHLYLCGVHIDVLLLKTVADAVKLYPTAGSVSVITDCCRGFVPQRFESSWTEMQKLGAQMVTSQEFLSLLKTNKKE